MVKAPIPMSQTRADGLGEFLAELTGDAMRDGLSDELRALVREARRVYRDACSRAGVQATLAEMSSADVD